MIRKTFAELKLTGQLPSPPGVGMKILTLTQGEDFSADDIGKAIMTDAALTGRLLKIANSAQAASSARPVATVSEATMRLGVRAVRNVALGLSLISAYRSGGCATFDYDRYWSASLARAVAAQSISRGLGIGQPPEAYILGLLADIGSLALACVYPEAYGRIQAEHGHDRAAMRTAEQQRFEINHGEVGAYMIEEWGLPAAFADAIQNYHKRSEPQSGESNQLRRVLFNAHVLAEACIATEEDPSVDWCMLFRNLERLREDLELGQPEFDNFCRSVMHEWEEWGTTLKVPARRGIDITRIPQMAAKHGARPQASGGSGAAPGPSAATDTDVVLPAASGQVPSSTASTGDPLGSSTPRSLRILAVDDDLVSLKVLERLLVKFGHQVLCARDGNEALQLALETNPQVVIADWMMPGLNGLDVCRSLRRIESGRGIFFLLLTGRSEEDRVVEAFDAGVDDFVVKPFNPRILMARLKGGQRVLELREQVEAERHTVRSQVAELGLLTRKLRTAALTDVLTELPNRRYAMKRLEQEWDASIRNQRPLSVIMIDVDHFKKVNDVHGHDVGDTVLKETSVVLRRVARQGEEPSRLGGEEFLVICANTTLQQAQVCAERIRGAIEKHQIRGGTFDGHVTVSLGVAERTASMTTIDSLIKSADEAVYLAKSSGRNCVRCAPAIPMQSPQAKAG